MGTKLNFGSNLKALRLKARLTQDSVAVACNVDRTTVTKWENGEYYPRVDKLFLLANLFKCSINRLFKTPN